jgi:hypothetical protein
MLAYSYPIFVYPLRRVLYNKQEKFDYPTKLFLATNYHYFLNSGFDAYQFYRHSITRLQILLHVGIKLLSSIFGIYFQL